MAKSRRDIREQMIRLLQRAQRDNFDFNDRQNRIIDIASAYDENIMRTKRYARDAREISTSIGPKRHENYERMDNRKYSIRTYMGLAKG